MGIEFSTTETGMVTSSPRLITIYTAGGGNEFQTCEMVVPELGAIDILTNVGNLDSFEIGDVTDLQTILIVNSPWRLHYAYTSVDPERTKIFAMP